MQPESNLGQFNSHGVLINAENDAFQDHTSHNKSVIQLIVADMPAICRGLLHDMRANLGDLIRKWRLIECLGIDIMDLGFGIRHGLQHSVCEVVNEADKEMAASHRRVANLEVNECSGRIQPR